MNIAVTPFWSWILQALLLESSEFLYHFLLFSLLENQIFSEYLHQLLKVSSRHFNYVNLIRKVFGTKQTYFLVGGQGEEICKSEFATFYF